MNIFKAGVQYDDFKGGVAADRADDISFLDYLIENNLAKEGERLAGYRLCFSGNQEHEIEKPGIVAYLFEADGFEERPTAIRAVEVDLTTAKLFSFFKRFDLVMIRKGMNLDDVPVEGPH